MIRAIKRFFISRKALKLKLKEMTEDRDKHRQKYLDIFLYNGELHNKIHYLEIHIKHTSKEHTEDIESMKEHIQEVKAENLKIVAAYEIMRNKYEPKC